MKLVADDAQVTVSATLGGIGPTFDALALALGMTDTVKAKAITGPSVLRQVSRGASIRPAILRLHGDDAANHPTVVALHFILDQVGSPRFGVELAYEAGIPRGVGLGDMEAQVLAGFLLAKQMLGSPDELGWKLLLEFARDFHLDESRTAATLFGGLTQMLPRGEEPLVPPLRFEPLPQIAPTVFVPDFTVDEDVKKLLPQSVQFRRNVANVRRAAALVPVLTGKGLPEALAGDEDSESVWHQYLMEVLADDIYQVHREPISPASVKLVEWLRSYDVPAVLSGAGPAAASLLPPSPQIIAAARRSGWETFDAGVRMEPAFL